MIVLLVADDPDLRQVLEIILRDQFDVRSSATSNDGLRTLRTECVDALLIDLDLPGTGAEALARTARTLYAHVGIVAMSGDPARLEAGRALADAVIAKPFPLAVVSAALRRAQARAGSSGSPSATVRGD
jgi:DNA-binding response OmpR family regulator